MESFGGNIRSGLVASSGSSVFEMPVPQVLAALGKGTPDTPEFRQYTRRGMFLSPFVCEKTPSFHWVNNRGQNCWHCFATGQGGGVRELVMLCLHCDERHAIEFLENVDPSKFCTVDWKKVDTSGSGEIIVDSYGPIVFRSLFEYGASRGIPSEILSIYCCQARYHYANNLSRCYQSLGFSNIRNGFSLMNRTKKGKIKICSSCAPTFIDASGCFSFAPASDSVVVFEGLWDFLSWLVYSSRDVPGVDVVVLNSLSMVGEGSDADRYIGSHSDITLFLDHDPVSMAGQKKTAELVRRYAGRLVKDGSLEFYPDYKDFNDMLIARRKAVK